MRKHYNLFFVAAALLCGSCSEEVLDTDDFIEGYEVTEEPAQSPLSDVKITIPSGVLGMDSHSFFTSLQSRCTNIVDASSADLLFVSGTQVNAHSDDIVSAYKKGVSIAVLAPVYDDLASLCKANNIPFVMSKDSDVLLYVFNNNLCYYTIDDLPKNCGDATYEPLVDSFAGWCRDTYRAGVRSSATEAVEDLCTAQSITHTFSIGIEGELATVLWSKPDSLKKYSTVDVSYNVYPVYAFDAPSTSSPGDYYLVEGSFTVHNSNMYNGKWTNKHGGVYSRLCGYYLSNFDITTNLMKVKGDTCELYTGMSFPAGGTPSPDTTIGSTSYSHSLSWSVSGNVNIGVTGGKPTATMQAGFSVGCTDTESRTMSDVDIKKNSSNNQVNYNYEICNLPTKAGPAIDPTIPSVAIADMCMYYSWVWYLPDVEAYSEDEYAIQIKMTPIYEGYHWYSSAADYDDYEFNAGAGEYIIKLIAPSRIPTGELTLTNTSRTHQYIGDVKIWEYLESGSYSTTPDYTIDTTIASSYSSASTSNTEAAVVLPVGKYVVEFVRYNVDENGVQTDVQTMTTASVLEMSIGDRLILDGGSADFVVKNN